MTKIKEALVESNPWWKEEYRVEFKKREVYEHVKKFLPLPQMIAFTGLRRVGKTTIMLKLVEDSIETGFDPQRIVYFSFDDFSEVSITDVIREYERITGRSIWDGRCMLFFDEIQKLKNWEEQIKRIYDTHKGNVKIILSGSESLFIRKKSKETLAGRMFEFQVEPLSFREFLHFKGVKPEPVGIYERELARAFDEFVLTCGFPELAGIKDKDVIKKYTKESIVEKVVYKDMPRIFKIKDITVIESLLNIFMEEPGQLVEIADLADEVGISRQTLSNYLSYLEESFLLRKIYNFSRSRRKVERKMKKYYPAVPSADLLFREDPLSRSKVFEWQVVTQLKPEFFWRDPYKNEVDMVFANRKIIPIEIKYGKIDTGGLPRFMKKFGVDKGFVISYDKEEVIKLDGKTVAVIPAFKFLITKPKL